MTKRNHLDSFPLHIVEAALKRQMGRCALCGRKLTGKLPEGVGMAAHHLLRVADNGATHIDNCVVLCTNQFYKEAEDCHFEAHGYNYKLQFMMLPSEYPYFMYDKKQGKYIRLSNDYEPPVKK